jgi:hypothetical protein
MSNPDIAKIVESLSDLDDLQIACLVALFLDELEAHDDLPTHIETAKDMAASFN